MGEPVTVLFKYGLLFLALLASAGMAMAEYRLQSSDVLELSVVGVPDLQRRATIDLDGNVAFPLVGKIPAQGKTLTEIREEFSTRIASKGFDQVTDAGVRTYFISPDQVTIDIAEYRPVYIRGDVVKPGEQIFRPGLTVRQVVAVAGGYDLLRFGNDNPFVQAANLRSEYDSLWIEFADAQAVVARIVAELTGEQALDRTGFTGLPVSGPLLDEIARSENEQLSLRVTDLENEKRHLARLIDQSQKRFDLLREEQAKVEEDRDAATLDFNRIEGLLDKGLLTANRMTEARRALLSSSLRFLSTTAELGAAGESVEGFKRQLEKVDVDRRLELTRQLKEAKLTLAKTLSELGAVSEKLLHVGSVRSTLAQGLAGTPRITIYDGRDAGSTGRSGAESDVLSPGDVVEIVLEPPAAALAASDDRLTTGSISGAPPTTP